MNKTLGEQYYVTYIGEQGPEGFYGHIWNREDREYCVKIHINYIEEICEALNAVSKNKDGNNEKL